MVQGKNETRGLIACRCFMMRAGAITRRLFLWSMSFCVTRPLYHCCCLPDHVGLLFWRFLFWILFLFHFIYLFICLSILFMQIQTKRKSYTRQKANVMAGTRSYCRLNVALCWIVVSAHLVLISAMEQLNAGTVRINISLFFFPNKGDMDRSTRWAINLVRFWDCRPAFSF